MGIRHRKLAHSALRSCSHCVTRRERHETDFTSYDNMRKLEPTEDYIVEPTRAMKLSLILGPKRPKSPSLTALGFV